MMKYVLRVAAPLALAALFAATTAQAAPVVNGLALKNAVPSSIEQVQWRRGGGWGRGWGYGIGGFAAGAIIGSAIARPYPYYGYYGYPAPYGYYPPPVYAAPPVAYAAPPPGDAVAYCMQRFRSYDPGSQTYLGYDNMRHPCP